MQTITAGYPTQIMAVDLLGPLPESKNGNRYVLVVGDYFSRWMEALPVPNQEASTIAEKLYSRRDLSSILATGAIALRPRPTV